MIGGLHPEHLDVRIGPNTGERLRSTAQVDVRESRLSIARNGLLRNSVETRISQMAMTRSAEAKSRDSTPGYCQSWRGREPVLLRMRCYLVDMLAVSCGKCWHIPPEVQEKAKLAACAADGSQMELRPLG